MNNELQEVFEFSFQGKSYNELSRHDVRVLILHLLYMLYANDYDISLNSIVDNIHAGFDFEIPKDSYAFKTAQDISEHRDELDKQIQPLLKNWKIDRLGICTRLILQMALWELQNSDTHSNIIIDESVELAKTFSEKDAYKFVNGVLDQLSKSLN